MDFIEATEITVPPPILGGDLTNSSTASTEPATVSPGLGSLRRDFIGTFATSGLRLVFSGLTGVLLARSLGPVVRGEFALMLLWTSALTTLVLLGTNEAVAYYTTARSRETGLQLKAGLHLTARLVSIGVPIGAAVGFVLLRNLSTQARAIGVVLIALCMPLHALHSVTQGYLQGASRFRSLNLMLLANDVVYCFLALTATVLVRHNGPALLLAVAAFLGTAAFSAANSVRLIRHDYQAAAVDATEKAVRDDIKTYGQSVAAANLITFLGTRLDEIVAAQFLTMKALGLYSVAKMAMVGINAVPVALTLVLLPKIVSAHKSGRVMPLFQKTLWSSIAVCSAGLGLSFVAIPRLVPFVFGQQYTESITVAQLLVLSAALSAIIEIGITALKGMNQLRLALLTRGLVLFLLFAALMVLVPRYGLNGAASACAFANGTGIIIVLAAVFGSTRPAREVS